MKSPKIQHRIGYDYCCLEQATDNKSLAHGDISVALTHGVKDEE